jgi:hypothetical protein
VVPCDVCDAAHQPGRDGHRWRRSAALVPRAARQESPRPADFAGACAPAPPPPPSPHTVLMYRTCSAYPIPSHSGILLPQTHVVISEEPGWRGVALPLLLAATGNAVVASIILGAIWALWHLPMFFVKGVWRKRDIGALWSDANRCLLSLQGLTKALACGPTCSSRPIRRS